MLIIHHKLSQQMWVQKVLRREPFNWTTELFKKQRMKHKSCQEKKNSEIKVFWKFFDMGNVKTFMNVTLEKKNSSYLSLHVLLSHF